MANALACRARYRGFESRPDRGCSWCKVQSMEHPCEGVGCSVVTTNLRFCSRRCSATVTNREVPRRQRTRTEHPCHNEQCNAPTRNKRYCSPPCQHVAQRNRKIAEWLAGERDGNKMGALVRWYMRETQGNQCNECGWARVHPLTGRVPLILDHKDGDWTNTTYENLQLLCGACNSLTLTFGALNSLLMRSRRGLPAVSVSRRKAGVM